MDLLSNIRAGDEHAFNTLYREYCEKVYFFILKKSSSDYLAEEVTQQAFIRVWERRHRLSEEYTIEEQLFRIARTILIDELRKESIKRKYVHQHQTTTPIVSPNELDAKEMQLRIDQAINFLPPQRRKIFIMSRYEQLTYKEIADALSLSVKTVEAQMSKALQQLKNGIILMALLELLKK
jgi:RNA polymerase sigma-70 factor (ECF subfamily)